MDVQTVTAAVGGIKTAIDIARSIAAISKDAEVKAKVIELQNVILDLQGNLLTMQNDYLRLAKALADKEAWEEIERRYQLQEVCESTYVYTLRPELQQGEPTHYLCPNCFTKRHKSILQTAGGSGSEQHFFCPTCKMFLKIKQPGMA